MFVLISFKTRGLLKGRQVSRLELAPGAGRLGRDAILGSAACRAESICRSDPWQIREEGEDLGPRRMKRMGRREERDAFPET